MSINPTFRAPQQVPLPTSGEGDDVAVPEGVKLEHTAKGPRWSIRVHNHGDDLEQVRRIKAIDDEMRREFGQPA